MTHESPGVGGALYPPFSVDLLADLHAGVLSEQQAAELWPRVNADPQARAVIDALEATTADLGQFAQAPAEPMPADVAARIDTALAEEQRQRQASPSGQATGAGSAPVTDINAARKRRNRTAGWGAGVLAAAAAAVAAVSIAVPSNEKAGTPQLAQPAPDQGGGAPGLALRSDDLNASAVGPALGMRDFGPLGNEERLDACLAANNIDPNQRPAGVRTVTIDGQPAVLTILPGGKLGALRLVVLSPSCGQGNPGLIKDELVGPK